MFKHGDDSTGTLVHIEYSTDQNSLTWTFGVWFQSEGGSSEFVEILQTLLENICKVYIVEKFVLHQLLI